MPFHVSAKAPDKNAQLRDLALDTLKEILSNPREAAGTRLAAAESVLNYLDSKNP